MTAPHSHPLVSTAFEGASDAHFLRFPTPLQTEAHKRAKERHARLGAMVVLANAGRAVLALPKPVAEPAGPTQVAWSTWFSSAHALLGRHGMGSATTIHEIQRTVCARYRVELNELLSPRREAKLVRARMIAVYLTKVMTGKGLTEIGKHFGDRDHTTILHSATKIGARMAADPAFASEVEGLRAEIGSIHGLMAGEAY